VGRATVGTNLQSQAGYALISAGPVVVEDLRAENRFADAELLLEHGVLSGLSTTIHVGGRAHGVLSAHTNNRRTFTEDEVLFLQEVAEVLGAAIERHRAERDKEGLLGERAAWAAAAERRFSFLAEANALLSASTDYRTVLKMAARLTVPAIADWCFVDVVEETEGSVSRFAVAHSDPEDEALARALQSTYRLDPSRAHGTARVYRTGAPEVISELDEAVLEEIGVGDPEHLEALRRVDAGSYICVPLRVGGHALGAMGLISARSGRRYGAEDVALAEGVAHCAALALNNARHHASEVELVRELVRRASEEQRVISLPRKDAPQITPRQMEVLRLLSSGHSTREIGRELYLSEATVRNHIRGLLQAFGAHSQLEVLARARPECFVEAGVIPQDSRGSVPSKTSHEPLRPSLIDSPPLRGTTLLSLSPWRANSSSVSTSSSRCKTKTTRFSLVSSSMDSRRASSAPTASASSRSRSAASSQSRLRPASASAWRAESRLRQSSMCSSIRFRIRSMADERCSPIAILLCPCVRILPNCTPISLLARELSHAVG
jgi:GAF domain-containing protein